MTKQEAYRERVAAGRRMFLVEAVEVDLEEMLRGVGYHLPDGCTAREVPRSLVSSPRCASRPVTPRESSFR